MKNQARFTGKAEIYARFRPGYPDALLDWLWQEAKLVPGSRIADIGSGTGIFSEQLLARGLEVWGVEPNTDMRALAEEALAGRAGFTSVSGDAEATGLAEHAFDLVTAAQSFHWFDPGPFGEECRRILKPDAPVALIWNSREPRNALVVENAGICRKYCREFYGFSGNNAADRTEIFEGFFRDGAYLAKSFDNPQRYDLEAFIGRNLSSSYAPQPEERIRAEFIAALTELFRKYADDDGTIAIPHRTRCIFGRV